MRRRELRQAQQHGLSRQLGGVLAPFKGEVGGTHFVEYLVLALVVLLATVYFFETELQTEGGRTRVSVKTAFDSLCNKIAGVDCLP